MLPTTEHYRAYGRELGRRVGPVDWYGFSQMKRWDHGILPNLRQLAGFNDPTGKGTYTQHDGWESRQALDALVEGFRLGADHDHQAGRV